MCLSPGLKLFPKSSLDFCVMFVFFFYQSRWHFRLGGDLKNDGWCIIYFRCPGQTLIRNKFTSQGAVLIVLFVFKVVYMKAHTVVTSFVTTVGAKHLWLCCGSRSSPEISCQSSRVGGSVLSLFSDLKVWFRYRWPFCLPLFSHNVLAVGWISFVLQ